MGNDQSMVDESVPPRVLEDRNLQSVANLIKNGKAKRIVVMTGAGLSTAAGIPDFRSPETGLYANLGRLNLPDPTSVFELDFFRSNPKPFYILAKELYPGNFSPTLSHVFINLLAKKGLLLKLFTQNIDCLERQARVPDDLIIECHGSFATQRCIDCRTPFPDDIMKQHVMDENVPHCVADDCDGLVKPDIVFFGESLPAAFFRARETLLETADLAIVIGTSLNVRPFASLPEQVPDLCPRVLFNMDHAGDFGTRPDDVLSLGDCNMGICALADYLGWLDELNDLWRETVGYEEADKQLERMKATKKKMVDEMKEMNQATGRGGDATDEDEEEESGSEGDAQDGDDNGGQGSSGQTEIASADATADDAPAGPKEPTSSTSPATSFAASLDETIRSTANLNIGTDAPKLGTNAEQQDHDVIYAGGYIIGGGVEYPVTLPGTMPSLEVQPDTSGEHTKESELEVASSKGHEPEIASSKEHKSKEGDKSASKPLI